MNGLIDLNQMTECFPLLQHVYLRSQIAASIKIMLKEANGTSPKFMDVNDSYDWDFVTLKSRIMLNQF